MQEVHKEAKTHLHSESAELTIDIQRRVMMSPVTQNEEREYGIIHFKNATQSIYFQRTRVQWRKAATRL